jgi:hypothetical protein
VMQLTSSQAPWMINRAHACWIAYRRSENLERQGCTGRQLTRDDAPEALDLTAFGPSEGLAKIPNFLFDLNAGDHAIEQQTGAAVEI